MLTPPLHPSAAVPFKWEEQPGKPFPCTAIILCPPQPNTKSLELPPRLQLTDLYSKMTKMPSPTTVLDGPYLGKSVTSSSSSSSFRFTRERHGSFGSRSTCCGSPEKAMGLSKNKERCFLGSWRRKTSQKGGGGDEDEDDEGNLVFLPPMDLEGLGHGSDEVGGDGCTTRVKMSRTRRKGSSSSIYHVRSHFWANIYDGFKNVLPWKSRKLKKDGVFV